MENTSAIRVCTFEDLDEYPGMPKTPVALPQFTVLVCPLCKRQFKPKYHLAGFVRCPHCGSEGDF